MATLYHLNKDEIGIIRNCLYLRIEELEDKLNNYDEFGCGIKEMYQDELKAVKTLYEKI